jgi:hypothetical protein
MKTILALALSSTAASAETVEEMMRARAKLDSLGTAGEKVLAVALIALAISIYFLPSFAAHSLKKTNFTAIFVLNLFLGWTLLGWVVALVWALTKDSSEILREQLAAIERQRQSRP